MAHREPTPAEMDPGGPPVVEDETLPLMDTDPGSDVMGMSREGADSGGLMGAVLPIAAQEEYDDMEPAPTPGPSAAGAEAADFAAGRHGEGYVRLVVQVTRDRMRVVGASAVDGPLARSDLTGRMAYEAQVHGRLIAAEAFDDLAEQHGYPPPDQPELGHRVGRTDLFQFVARIPRSELTLDELADLEITLVRPESTTALVEEVAATPGVGFADAAAAAGREPPEVVARMAGMDLTDLPADGAQALRRALR